MIYRLKNNLRELYFLEKYKYKYYFSDEPDVQDGEGGQCCEGHGPHREKLLHV